VYDDVGGAEAAVGEAKALNAKGAKGAKVRHGFVAGFVVVLVAGGCRRFGESVKPHCFRGIYGMAEAVPLTKPCLATSEK